MSEPIDHAAEAFRVLKLPTAMEDATEANALAYAQVHATLALVEQQRIANLIALGSAEHGPYRYLDAGLTVLRSMDAFGVAAHLLGIGEPHSEGESHGQSA